MIHIFGFASDTSLQSIFWAALCNFTLSSRMQKEEGDEHKQYLEIFTFEYLWIPPILLKHGRALYAQFTCTFLLIFLFSNQHLRCITKMTFIGRLPSWLKLINEGSDLISGIVCSKCIWYILHVHSRVAENKPGTWTPGRGFPTKPGLRSPWRGLDRAMTNCKYTMKSNETRSLVLAIAAYVSRSIYMVVYWRFYCDRWNVLNGDGFCVIPPAKYIREMIQKIACNVTYLCHAISL